MALTMAWMMVLAMTVADQMNSSRPHEPAQASEQEPPIRIERGAGEERER